MNKRTAILKEFKRSEAQKLQMERLKELLKQILKHFVKVM